MVDFFRMYAGYLAGIFLLVGIVTIILAISIPQMGNSLIYGIIYIAISITIMLIVSNKKKY